MKPPVKCITFSQRKSKTELRERGIGHIKKLAIVFSGKDVLVKEKKS